MFFIFFQSPGRKLTLNTASRSLQFHSVTHFFPPTNFDQLSKRFDFRLCDLFNLILENHLRPLIRPNCVCLIELLLRCGSGLRFGGLPLRADTCFVRASFTHLFRSRADPPDHSALSLFCFVRVFRTSAKIKRLSKDFSGVYRSLLVRSASLNHNDH